MFTLPLKRSESSTEQAYPDLTQKSRLQIVNITSKKHWEHLLMFWKSFFNATEPNLKAHLVSSDKFWHILVYLSTPK